MVKKHFLNLSTNSLIYILSSVVLLLQFGYMPLHGDGAFYASVIADFAQKPSLIMPRPNGAYFFDHPYLFFYLSSLSVIFFGVHDFAVKLPNYIFAAFTFFVVFKIYNLHKIKHTFKNNLEPCTHKNLSVNAFSIFLLITLFMAGYELQIRQPSLDPLAHLWALSSFYFLLQRKWSLSGLMLGLAFCTKATELLPYVAAITCFQFYQDVIFKPNYLKNTFLVFKNLLKIAFWALVPIFIFLFLDYWFKVGWLHSYYAYQFSGRFLTQNHLMNHQFFWGALKFIFITMQPWFFIWLFFLARFFIKNKTFTKLSVFTLFYGFFLLTAFTLIKKDSSQHFTGLYIFLAASLAEIIFIELQNINQTTSYKLFVRLRWFIKGLLAIASAAFIYLNFINNSKDFWTMLQRKASELQKKPEQVIVIDPLSSRQEEIYWTGQWYWKNLIYAFQLDERVKLELNQPIFLIKTSASNQDIEVIETSVNSELLSKLKK